jgi:ATP-dependent helicase/nuclease subunit A
MNWTEEQKQIIGLRNSNILVSAAAGSGKTAVMVERIIELIKKGEDIDKFLVLTFTKAAAAGMKQRIQKSLMKAAQAKEGNVNHLRRQLSLINRAMITTIDSFCMDLVKKNFHLADVDPDFRVGDQSELTILLQEAIDEALEEEYEKINDNDSFRKLVEGFTGNRGDEDLSRIILTLYRFILSFPDPFPWLWDSVEKLNIRGEELQNSNWLDEIKSYFLLLLDGAKDYIRTAIEICLEPHGPGLYMETLQKDMDLVDGLIGLLETDMGEFMRAVKEFKAPKAPPFREKDHPEVDVEKQVEVGGSKNNRSLRIKYKSIIDSIKNDLPHDLDYDRYAREIREMYGTMTALRDLIIKTDEYYKEKKKENSLVDFNDLEHLALKILRNPETASYYRKKYKYIFIDEYQDSNGLQEAIINQIKREDNLFMVGDVKQSIYRFRLADPGIFNSKYRAFKEDIEAPGGKKANRAIDLNKNFRSRDEILKAVNFIFGKIMTRELGEVDYDEKAALNTGSDFPGSVPVELNIIHKNSHREDLNSNKDEETRDEELKSEADLEIESMETAELEALFAAQRIKDLVKEEIYTSGKGEARKTEYRDIVILLRSVAGWAGIFEDRFNREGIPFYYDGGKGFYETLEVKIILNLLKLIDNTRQDIPLLSVMRSPLGNFTTEELLEIRLSHPEEKYFTQALNKYIRSACEGGEASDLAQRLKSFMDKIYDWNYRSRYMHLNDLIWDILTETNYYNFAGALPNGKVRQANLRMLADLASDYDKTSMRGLFKFLRYVEKLAKGSEDRGQAKTLGEKDNVVRLMSIHKSKGLEFPVVLICGLNKQFNLQDTKNKILLHKDYGIAPKYVNVDERTERETLARTAIRLKIKKENISEEMRVLYVAMTRPIDRLIMAGTVSKLENKHPNWRRGYSKYAVYKGLSYMDWICGCLFERTSFDKFNEIMKEGRWKNWNLNMIRPYDLSLNAKEETDTKISKIAGMKDFKKKENSPHCREIDRRLSFKYPHGASVHIPAKLSVTELKNLGSKEFTKLRYHIPTLVDVFKYDDRDERFIIDKDIKGAEVGTLLHFVMEHLNLRGDLKKPSIIKTINQMKEKKLLTEAEADIAINTYAEKIEDFFKKDLGRRIINSNCVYREAPFVLKKHAKEVMEALSEEDLILVQGIIDCYFIEDGEAVILDYKTDRIDERANICSQINKLTEEYRDQVLLYREAVEKLTGLRVKEAYLYFFSIGKEVLVPF